MNGGVIPWLIFYWGRGGWGGLRRIFMEVLGVGMYLSAVKGDLVHSFILRCGCLLRDGVSG